MIQYLFLLPWYAAVQLLMTFALTLIAFAVQLWAFVDCVRRPAVKFEHAFKRTKNFWMLITGISLLVGASYFAQMLGFNTPAQMFIELIAVSASAVYLADVKPEVSNSTNRPYGY